MKSRWQDLFAHLKKNNINVFSPSSHEGECREKYVVVKNNGNAKLTYCSTCDDYYSVMCYVPKNEYSELECYVEEVKKVMKGIEPMFLPAGSQTPSFYDDTVKAHMISIEYKNHKKL